MDDELRAFVGRIVRLAVMIAIVGIALNDGIQVARGFSQASKGLNAATSASLDAAAKAPSAVDVGKAAATAAAEAQGTQLDAYEQTVGESVGSRRAQVTLTVSRALGKTVVAAPIIGIIRGAPSSSWYPEARISLRSRKQVDLYGTTP